MLPTLLRRSGSFPGLGIGVCENKEGTAFGFVWLRAGRPGFDPGGRRGGNFTLLLRVQTGPGVYSTSYKMSTGEFLRGKFGRA